MKLLYAPTILIPFVFTQIKDKMINHNHKSVSSNKDITISGNCDKIIEIDYYENLFYS